MTENRRELDGLRDAAREGYLNRVAAAEREYSRMIGIAYAAYTDTLAEAEADHVDRLDQAWTDYVAAVGLKEARDTRVEDGGEHNVG